MHLRRWDRARASGLCGALALLGAACSDAGLGGQTGPGGGGTGGGSTGNLVTSAEGDDGIDPSLPTATSPATGTTGGQDSTVGSGEDPTPTDSGDDGATQGPPAETGTTGVGGSSSESGEPSDDDGLTFGTGGTLETLEFSDSDGLPTFGDTGTPATNCVSIDVPADGFDVVVEVELEAAFTHTYVGDVGISVAAPDGTTLTVLNRPGHPAAGNFGDDSDTAAAIPLTFTDDATASAEDMGSTLGPGLVICGADAICDYLPAPDATGTGGGVGTSFADFAGLASDGQWMVCFTDNADEDALTVEGATLRITKSM